MIVGTQSNLEQTANISKPFMQELNLAYQSNSKIYLQLNFFLLTKRAPKETKSEPSYKNSTWVSIKIHNFLD